MFSDQSDNNGILGELINSAEIIAIGTEILMGQITNTNASFLAKELSGIGIPSYYQTVVGDNPDRLEKVIKVALERSDAIIMTGGLGPTQDDISMETAARALGRKLVCHEESRKRIELFFAGIGRPMVNSNLKQAMLPEGAIVINNNRGTAPGAIIEKVVHDGKNSKTKRIILLPGPPLEMNPMFLDSLRDYLIAFSPMQIHSVYIKLFGIGESSAEEKIKDIINSQINPTIAPYCSTGECLFRVSYSAVKDVVKDAVNDKANDTANETARLISDIEIPEDRSYEQKIEQVVSSIKERLSDYIYEIGQRSMPEVVSDLLRAENSTVSFAESCTAGLLTSMIGDIPGASDVLKGSVICYSNQSKTEILGVSTQTLVDYGAVSKNTAEEMALGCIARFKSDYAVSVTGIAGPGGGSPGREVGTIFITITDGTNVETEKFNFKGDRQKIRYISALNALNLLRRKILK